MHVLASSFCPVPALPAAPHPSSQERLGLAPVEESKAYISWLVERSREEALVAFLRDLEVSGKGSCRCVARVFELCFACVKPPNLTLTPGQDPYDNAAPGRITSHISSCARVLLRTRSRACPQTAPRVQRTTCPTPCCCCSLLPVRPTPHAS